MSPVRIVKNCDWATFPEVSEGFCVLRCDWSTFFMKKLDFVSCFVIRPLFLRYLKNFVSCVVIRHLFHEVSEDLSHALWLGYFFEVSEEFCFPRCDFLWSIQRILCPALWLDNFFFFFSIWRNLFPALWLVNFFNEVSKGFCFLRCDWATFPGVSEEFCFLSCDWSLEWFL